MSKGRVHLVIHGYVQGVFYRASTRETAMRLGVTGWVRNLPDGNVEAIFEGNIDQLHQAIDWCREGPPGANVLKVNDKWTDYVGEFKSFEVRY